MNFKYFSKLNFRNYFASSNKIKNISKIKLQNYVDFFGVKQINRPFCSIKTQSTMKTDLKQENNKFQYIQHSLNDLLSRYEKQNIKSSLLRSPTFIKQLIKASNNQGMTSSQNQKILNCVSQVLDKYITVIQRNDNAMNNGSFKNNLLKLVQTLCYQNFIKNVNKKQLSDHPVLLKIGNKGLVEYLLKIYESVDLREKKQITKFVAKYHANSIQVQSKFRDLVNKTSNQVLKSTSAQQIINYMKQSMDYFEQKGKGPGQSNEYNYEFFQQILNKIYEKIALVNPYYLHGLTKMLIKLNSQPKCKKLINFDILITGVSQHLKGLRLIQSLNPYDSVYLLQTLQKIKAMKQPKPDALDDKIKELTLGIYDLIKQINKNLLFQEQEDSQKQKQQQQNEQSDRDEQEIPEKQICEQKVEEKIKNYQQLNLFNVNIILESMLRLSVIDANLFRIMENKFLKLVMTSNMKEIECYIKARNKIAKAVMESIREQNNDKTAEKLRLVKQQHKRFILNLLEVMNKSPSLSGTQKLLLLQICQQLPIKYRKIKKTITETIQINLKSPEQIAFAEVVKASF